MQGAAIIRTLTERVVGQSEGDVDKRKEGAFPLVRKGWKSVELFASAQHLILGAMVRRPVPAPRGVRRKLKPKSLTLEPLCAVIDFLDLDK